MIHKSLASTPYSHICISNVRWHISTHFGEHKFRALWHASFNAGLKYKTIWQQTEHNPKKKSWRLKKKSSEVLILHQQWNLEWTNMKEWSIQSPGQLLDDTSISEHKHPTCLLELHGLFFFKHTWKYSLILKLRKQQHDSAYSYIQCIILKNKS